MKKGRMFFAIVIPLCSALAWAQATSAFSVAAVPTFDIPMGVTLSGSSGTALYSLGYGLSLRGQYSLPFAASLSAGPVLDVDMATLNGSSKSALFLGVSGELAYTFYPAQRLSFRAGARGGIYLGSFEGESIVRPYVASSIDLGYRLTPSLGLDLGASYKAYLPYGEIFNAVGVQLGLQVNLGAGKAVMRVEPRIQPIFPLFYSYYDRNPAGSVEISNRSSSELRDVSVKFFVRQFMEQPKDCWSADSLPAGALRSVPVYALFKDSIFSVTEATKVAGEILLSYSYLGRKVDEMVPVTISVNNRNGMTWDDTRKIAAFVTSMDPSVRGFSLPVASMARIRGKQAVSANFRIAMAIFDELKVHEVGYVSDPVSPIETRMASRDEVDYLQFPVQTLAYKGGDCDDLSILYAALLESAGVAAAFVTVPGHIFIAFDLGMTAQEAKGFFDEPDSLIARDGEAWAPVEVTRVQDGFVRALEIGAQEWVSAKISGAEAFVPVREAWSDFAPANTGDIVKAQPSVPAADRVASIYDAEMARFFATEYQPKIDALKAEIARGKDLPKLRNRLGVVYARFGMLDEAKRQFEAAATAKDAPAPIVGAALINLGNIAYLGAKYQEAYDYYGKALGINPDNPVAVLGYARAAYELGKQIETGKALKDLGRLDPFNAAKYAYMGGSDPAASRAASAEKEVSSWSDEED